MSTNSQHPPNANSQASSEQRGIYAHQWQPGKSGNPGGRPKLTPITDWLRKLIDQPDGSGKTGGERIARHLVEVASSSGTKTAVPAAEMILDRIEGRVPSRLELDAHILVATPDQLIEASRRMELIAAQEVQLLEAHTEPD